MGTHSQRRSNQRRSALSCCGIAPLGLHGGCSTITPTAPREVGVTQMQPNASPMGRRHSASLFSVSAPQGRPASEPIGFCTPQVRATCVIPFTFPAAHFLPYNTQVLPCLFCKKLLYSFWMGTNRGAGVSSAAQRPHREVWQNIHYDAREGGGYSDHLVGCTKYTHAHRHTHTLTLTLTHTHTHTHTHTDANLRVFRSQKKESRKSFNIFKKGNDNFSLDLGYG